MSRASLAALIAVLAGSVAPAARADEGMWPFNMAPIEAIQKRHGARLDDAWLGKVMRSSVRFGSIGSASFVSPNGLLVTNHHVASECIQALSAQEGSSDLMKEGFVAKTREEERRCPDLEILALRSIEDVTAQVRAAAEARGKGRSEVEKNAATKAEIARLEKSCSEKSDLRCEAVTLYSGGAYHLYRYQRYTDVRLVFAPELAVAFFGGDAENFTYPRFCLDVALLRAYEKDAPAKIEDHLRFSSTGPKKEGEPIFVSGHPRSTDRFAPVSKLELLKNVGYPFLLERLIFERDALKAFSAKGESRAKAARDELMETDNAIKAIGGYLSGLKDRELMDEARKREVYLLGKVRALKNKTKRDYFLEAWPKLEEAYRKHGEIYRQLAALERWVGPDGRLAEVARHLLRYAVEKEKKNELRLPEYRQSNLASLERSLFSTPPIDRELEVEKTAIGLSGIAAALGLGDPLVRKLLDGMTAHERARRAVEGTKLADVEVRKRLWRGGKKAIEAAKDPMIQLVAAYDARAREVRKKYEDQVESIERSYYGRIAEAYRAAFGTETYPDATFTLRLNDGRVASYSDEGKALPWHTTFGGMFAKHDESKGLPPHQLPERWLKAKEHLDLETPFDFVTTNDLIAGNSGSPMLGVDGKLAGVLFDGNLAQLPNRFIYRQAQARAIGVHARAVLHALSKVYEAEHLVQELTR